MPKSMQILFFSLFSEGLAHDRERHPSGSNQRMQVNKMGGPALDEAASSPPILCLILIVLLLGTNAVASDFPFGIRILPLFD